MTLLRALLLSLAALTASACVGDPCRRADRSLDLSRDQAIRIADRYLHEQGIDIPADRAGKTWAAEWERGAGWSIHYDLTDKEIPSGPVVDISNCTGEASFSGMNM